MKLVINNPRLVKEKLDATEVKGLKDVKMGTAVIGDTYDILIRQKYMDIKFLLWCFSPLVYYRFSFFFDWDGKQFEELIFQHYNNFGRQNWMKMIDKIGLCCLKPEYIMSKYGKKNYSFSCLKNFFYYIIWLYQMKDLEANIISKLYICYKFANARKWVSYLNSKSSIIEKAKCAIVLDDARLQDNVFVQFCQLHNIPVATLQHGDFIASHDRYINFHFEASISNRFFVWGERSKMAALKSGVLAKKIICVGDPTYIGDDTKIAENSSNNVKYDTYKNIFGVVLDGGTNMDKENRNLIMIANEISEKFKFRYIIRKHPSSRGNMKEFTDKRYFLRNSAQDETVKEFANSVSFAIAFNSSVLIELLYLGKVVFRWIDTYKEDRYLGFFDKYSTKDKRMMFNFVMLFLNNEKVIRSDMKKYAQIACQSGNMFNHYKQAIFDLKKLKKDYAHE